MKNLILVFVSLAFCWVSSANAKVWTVSNDSINFPAQYYNLQNVIDNIASDGDTILVSGTTTPIQTKSYDNIYITRPLTIIGAGAYLFNKVSNVTKFNYVYVDASEVNIIACNIYGILTSSNKTADNLNIKRNLINTISIGGNNVTITNNYITYLNINSFANIIVSNNIISGHIVNSSKSTVMISNNIFSFYKEYRMIQNISYAVFSNNIIFGIGRGSSGDIINCQFNNNLTYKLDNDTIPYGYNYGADNIIGKNPKFMDWDADNDFNGESIEIQKKGFKLKSDSPGKNAGTDGKDLGIYGGQYPWPEYLDNSSKIVEADIPTIRELKILNTVVGKNGKIKFQVIGEAVK